MTAGAPARPLTAVTPSLPPADPAATLTASVVVCAYTLERWGDLVAAVASLARQRPAPLEIVVVVDHNPELLERVRRELPGALAVANVQPRGLSGARNSGVVAAQGAVVAFLDDDAVAQPGWLESLLRAYAHPEVMGVGGTVEALWDRGRPAWFPAEFDWVVGCTYRGVPLQRSRVRNLIGANMSFRREVLDAVGHFHCGLGRVGRLPAGCEETELCIRANRVGRGEIVFEPAAGVLHRVPADRSRWPYFRSRCYAEGRSKALVAQFAGAADGLASERAYVRRTLPRGVARGIGDALLRRDLAGLRRAAAIGAGLAFTTAGYTAGRLAGDGS